MTSPIPPSTWLRLAVCSLALLFVVLGAPAPVHADGPPVIVEIEGLRSDRGEVHGALFASARGWTEEGREVSACHARIRAHRATCVLQDIVPGDYAFAFFHDENSNVRMDRDFFGWPQEGYGFSNDAAPGLGPPSFESARFHQVARGTLLHVHVRYGL